MDEAPGATVPLVKGSAIREFTLWYEARYGRAYAADVAAKLPAGLRDHIWLDRQALGIVASDWYPSAIVHALLDAVSAGRSDEEMCALIREANEVTVRRLTRGLYHFLFRMVASPRLYAKHVQKAWRMLHNTGTRRITLREGRAESTTDDWQGHHPWLCRVTMETMRSVFEAMGCSDVAFERIECIGRGHARCRAVMSYRDPS